MGTTALDRQLGDFVYVLIKALRSGYSLRQSLEAMAVTAPEPTAGALKGWLADLQAGCTHEEALAHLLAAWPSPHLAQIVEAILRTEERGDNPADQLEPLAEQIYQAVGSDEAFYPEMRRQAQELGGPLPERVREKQVDRALGRKEEPLAELVSTSANRRTGFTHFCVQQGGKTMKADAKTEAAVLAVMKEFAECYAKRDLRGMLALHAPDPDVVIFTPGGKAMGPDGVRALVEQDFSQHTELWTYGWTSVSAAGSVAWVAADVTLRLQGGGQEMTMVGSLTWVLENRGGKWLIVSGHVSFKAPAQAGAGSSADLSHLA